MDEKQSRFNQDQFKSTRKWNEIVETFLLNMPLKRHWRNFKAFSDCFTASEAVDWIFSYLKTSQNFQHLNITRQNAIKLLQIFLKEKIIVDVRATDNQIFKDFQDDDRIYRFSTNLKNYPVKTLNNVNSTASSASLSTLKALSTENIKILNCNTKLENSSINSECFLNEKISTLEIETENNEKKNENLVINNFVSAQLKDKSNEFKSWTYLNRSYELEIWSKMSKKMLESIIRKVYLQNNIKLSKENYTMRPGNGDYDFSMEFQFNKSVSPNSNSTLKRSSDLKINLSKLLDKKSNDILQDISGANIEYNCNNINKHGVVIGIDTEDDLPIWIVRAMHTLLNWESENDQDYPKFQDVYQEIVDYFNILQEPLLTNNLSYLFIQVLNIITTNTVNHESNHIIKDNPETLPKKYIKDIYNLKNFPYIPLIDNLICFCKNRIIATKKEQKNGNDQIQFCINSRVLDLIANASFQIKDEKNWSKFDNYIFEELEIKLIHNAQLPFFKNNLSSQNNEKIDISISVVEEIVNLFNRNKLSTQEKEIFLQNLLMVAIENLENCCENCSSIFNKLTIFFTKEIESKIFYKKNICNSKKEQNTNIFESNREAKPIDESLNEYFPNLNQITDFKVYNVNEGLEEQDFNLDNSNMTTFISNKKISKEFQQNNLNFSSYRSDTSVINRKIREKKLFRNNSFRAAIGEIPQVNETENKFKLNSSRDESKTISINRSSKSANFLIETSTKLVNKYGSNISETNRTDDDLVSDLWFRKSEKEIAKSKSMVLNDKKYMPNNDKDHFNSNSFNDSRKRKISSISSSIEFITQKIDSNNNSSNIKENYVSMVKSNSSTNLEVKMKKILPSFSLSSIDDLNHNSFKFEPYILNSCCDNFQKSKLLVNLSSKEIGTAIIKELNESKYRLLSCQKFDLENNDTLLNLNKNKENNLNFYIISAFRILTLMLPPSNKRKLHFLLRFLNKLKSSKHSEKYLINKQRDCFNEENTIFINKIENSKFKNDSTLKKKNLHNQFSNVLFSSTMILKEKNQLENMFKRTNENTSYEENLNSVETKIVNSFLRAIIKIECKNVNTSLMNESALKIIKIMINHYSEIMKIPDELLNSIKSKLNFVSKNKNNRINNENSMNNHCSLSNIKEYENKECKSKEFAWKLNNNPDLKNEVNSICIKNQSIFLQDNQKMKKAINILGLNDSISYSTFKKRESSKILSNVKNAIKDECEIDRRNFDEIYDSTSSIKSLTINSNINKSSNLNSTYISLPKFFSNKKFKKENLI